MRGEKESEASEIDELNRVEPRDFGQTRGTNGPPDGEPRLYPSTPNGYRNIKEKLQAYLASYPGGAASRDLVALLFSGAGSDPEVGARIVHGILDGDPNFNFDPATCLWSTRRNTSLQVPLDEAHFVVVDLETAAPRPAAGAIVEIGAYRMCGRRILDSFERLIRPRMRIPRFVTGLTGISEEMVAAAPPVEAVLGEFRAFLGDAVMVAHNAPFDRAFLDFEFRRLFGIGLENPVLCTLRIARGLLPSLKRRRLDLLAEHFGLSTAGRHRGLGDARMAAELLAIFIEIALPMGLTRLDRLLDQFSRGPAGRHIERHIAPEVIAQLPHTPGVYLMHNERGNLLYVGKATHLKERVGSYFGQLNLSAKTAELVNHVWSIETRATRSALEAALLEARLIRELKPPYNRQLKSAAPAYFIRIDLNDPFPRLQVTEKLTARPNTPQIGPFIGRRNLDRSIKALSRLLGLRSCAGRLAPDPNFSPCIYGQMAHCMAPCNLSVSRETYNEQTRRALALLRGRSAAILGELANAREHAASAMRFEQAERCHRDLEALATLTNRSARLGRVVSENNLVIVLGDGPRGAVSEGIQRPPAAYVVLSGRLALMRELDSRQAAFEVADFVRQNFDCYKLRPVIRAELEAMAIVARWLKERAPDDGRIIPLGGAVFDPDWLTR